MFEQKLLIEMFEYNSWEMCTSSTSRSQGQPAPEVERVTPRGRSLRPKACGRPKACAADFLKEVRLPETSRRSSMCATASTYGRDDDLTHYLYHIDMSK